MKEVSFDNPHYAYCRRVKFSDLTKFRSAIFWDTNLGKIDWKRKRKAITKRVFDRGNLTEKKELLRFYGRKAVKQFLKEKKITAA